MAALPLHAALTLFVPLPIPATAAAAAATTTTTTIPAATTTIPAAATIAVYTSIMASMNGIAIKPNPSDTLESLGVQYGLSAASILEANRMYAQDSIFARPYLQLPGVTQPLPQHKVVDVKSRNTSRRSSDASAATTTATPSVDDFLARFDLQFGAVKEQTESTLSQSKWMSEYSSQPVQYRPRAVIPVDEREEEPEDKSMGIPLTSVYSSNHDDGLLQGHTDEMFEL
ncbi:uncharacterized protein MONBRDRAFT_32647 [Monosiga brevicollis MX1]|uniref:LysM domain-containing protein n=1 Tax=Monosiga brevicollis TaxID=81824 RepID=A9V0W4_MONBE|nr:uncharacterized protein MONBRDRAFT_32647 [Monosiga brevicollis MX1]EDQ88827.1 predicted protein [Monosiga brevicollis MX1]|eukprot:XP_001746440.1 hypothetical protein [Monosiga brevicollis MX1]